MVVPFGWVQNNLDIVLQCFVAHIHPQVCEPNLQSLDAQTLIKTVGAMLIAYWLGES